MSMAATGRTERRWRTTSRWSAEPVAPGQRPGASSARRMRTSGIGREVADRVVIDAVRRHEAFAQVHERTAIGRILARLAGYPVGEAIRRPLERDRSTWNVAAAVDRCIAEGDPPTFRPPLHPVEIAAERDRVAAVEQLPRCALRAMPQSSVWPRCRNGPGVSSGSQADVQ